jgi:hypothetical protein
MDAPASGNDVGQNNSAQNNTLKEFYFKGMAPPALDRIQEKQTICFRKSKLCAK